MGNFKGQKHLKIDLGAGDIRDGEKSPEGYLRQDVDPMIEGLDIICDIENLDRELDLESCSKLRISHVLEHFPTASIPRIVKMLFNLLEKGGELEVIVPNFKWHAQLVLAGQEEQAVFYAFGGQLDKFDFHKTGFTPLILWKKLKEAGFGEVKIIDADSVTAIAKKI